MSRPPVALQWLGLTTMVMLMVVFAWLVMTPDGAEAQATGRAVVTVAVGSADGEGGLEAVIAVDPGSTTLAGLTAALHYDAANLAFVECAVSAAGACNDIGDGTVMFSVFDLAGFDANPELFTVTLAARGAKHDPAPFALEVIEAIDRQAGAIDGVVVESSLVDVAGGDAPDATSGDEPGAATRRPTSATAVTDPTAGVGGTAPATNSPAGAPQASISGSVVDRATGELIATATVCATQPLVLTEVCVPVDSTGHFGFSGLQTGNYLLVASDASGRYADSGASLVGVVSPATRDNIVIRLDLN